MSRKKRNLKVKKLTNPPDPIFIPNLNTRDGAASESMPLRKFGVLHQILLRGCEDGDSTKRYSKLVVVTLRLQEERKTGGFVQVVISDQEEILIVSLI